ncbi:uncharacterized protein LOC141529211 [Cotesia typhae]|uniref:uncharacterized protein LOC141529211 n=1 Tax=Cotesia typhae TaxID=2053667 RepID=UPI003D69B89F
MINNNVNNIFFQKKFDGLIIDQGETTYDCHISKATEHSKEKSYQSMHYDNNDKDQIVIEQINLSETIDNDQIDLNQDIEDISCKSLDQYCNEEIKGQDDLFTKLPGKTFDTEKNYVEMLFTNGMVSNKLNIKFDKNIESAQSKLMNQLSVIGEKDNSQVLTELLGEHLGNRDICVRQINQDFNKEEKNTAKMTSDISNEDNLIDIALLPIDMVDIQTLYDSEQDMLKYSSEYKISEQLNTILSYQLDGRTVDEVRDDDNILEDSPQLSPVILRNRTMRETNDLLNDSGSTQTHDETYNDDPSYINEMNLSDMTVASLSGLDSVDNLEKSLTLPAESDNAHSELLQDQLSHENEEENNDPGLDLAISKEISLNTQKGSIDNSELIVQQSNVPRWKKKYACPFCHKILVGQLPRHIRNVHGNIEDVKKLNNTSKGSAERKEILTVFRNNGAFSHNCNELYNKGTYTKANARKHISQCRKKQGESKNLKGQRVYYVMGKTIEARMLSTANDILRLVVFPVLQEDEIVRLIRYDWLIILYGNKLCIKYTAHYQHNMIRQINSTITQLADLFHPKCIQTVINAIGQIARINYLKNTCEVPAVALNVVTYIRQIAVMLETEYVVREEDQLQKQVANFLKVYNSEMSIAVNKVANESQAQLKRHKVVILPMSEDIQKLIIYIKTVKKIHFTNLKETFDYQSWLAASKLVAAYLLVFNRRRVGDVQNITVSDIDRLQSIDKHADKEEYNALDDEGKKIARNYYRIEIRGKLNKDVAVIASNDIIDELRLLISYRALADVPSDNDFVFGLPNGGTSRIRVINLCTVMRNLSVACGAEKPELLRGTQLRKHVATKCVEFELSDNALSDLTKHMGHSEKIHKDYYRKPIKSKTIVQVTKLLHAVHGTVDDKNDEEEDININDESEYVEYDSLSHSTGNDNMSNIPSETNEIYDSNFSSNSTQIPSGTEVTFDNVVPCTSSANYSSVLTDNGQFCEQNTPKDKPVVAMVSSIGFSRKKPYSSEEKRAIMTEFKDHFINQTLPSFEKIDELLAKYPCLKNRRRDWIKISKTTQRPSVSSPTSPAFLLSPVSDSVFDSPTTSTVTMFEQNSGATSSESQNKLPDGWFNKSTDEKLTLLMETLSTHSQSLSEIPNITKSSMNYRQKLNSKVKKLEDETIANSQVLSERIMAITSQTLMTPSTVVQQTSELIISGVPEPVATKLSPIDIADKVLEVLSITDLKQDILSIRKIDKKSNSTSSNGSANINNNSNKPISHSYILKLKSPQVRDSILESRRDLNCDLLSSSYVSNHLKTYISEQSLHCVPYGATHHTNNNETWLDVILLDNKSKQGAYFKSHQPFMNGHDYLVCEYLLNLPKRWEKQVKFRSFSDKNHNDLANSLMRSLNIGMDSLEYDDPNQLLNIFIDNALASLDEFAPLRTRKLHDAIRQITTDAQAVANWAKDNGLEINVNKTKAMLLGSSGKLKSIQQNFLPPIIVNDDSLMLHEVMNNLTANKPRVSLKRLCPYPSNVSIDKKSKYLEINSSNSDTSLKSTHKHSSDILNQKLSRDDMEDFISRTPNTSQTWIGNMKHTCIENVDISSIHQISGIDSNVSEKYTGTKEFSQDQNETTSSDLVNSFTDTNGNRCLKLANTEVPFLLTKENLRNIPIIFSNNSSNDDATERRSPDNRSNIQVPACSLLNSNAELEKLKSEPESNFSDSDSVDSDSNDSGTRFEIMRKNKFKFLTAFRQSDKDSTTDDELSMQDTAPVESPEKNINSDESDSDHDDNSISQSVLPDMLLDSNKSVKSHLDLENHENLVKELRVHQPLNELNEDSIDTDPSYIRRSEEDSTEDENEQTNVITNITKPKNTHKPNETVVIEENCIAKGYDVDVPHPIPSTSSGGPRIYVKTSNSGPKQHACQYCGKLYFKLARHITTVHKDEEEVRKIIAL